MRQIARLTNTMGFDRTSNKRLDFMTATRGAKKMEESYSEDSAIEQPMLARTANLVYNSEMEIMEG